MASPAAFSVQRSVPELVAPARPTPRGLKPLSDLDDQEGLRFDVPIIMLCRAHPSMLGRDPVTVLRTAIAAALVFYYPLAGRLVEGPDRKLLVDCTGEGVEFVEADGDAGLEELGDAVMPPCRSLEALHSRRHGWTDGILGRPILSFQVTRLRCGGFIVCLMFIHVMCDGTGLAQFLGAVGELARGFSSPSTQPVWLREALIARRPPRVTCIHREFEDAGIPRDSNGSPGNWVAGDTVERSFFFGPGEIGALRSRLPPDHARSSTSELIIACLFRCRVVALGLPPDEAVRISYLQNFRPRLPRGSVPAGYYGNAFVYPAEVGRAGWVCGAKENGKTASLGNAVEMLKKAKARMSEEYVRSVTDFLVVNGRRMFTADSNYIVSDVRNIGLHELDFGWGKPVYCGPATAVGIVSFIGRFINREGEDGAVAMICLPSDAMKIFGMEMNKMTDEPGVDSSARARL